MYLYCCLNPDCLCTARLKRAAPPRFERNRARLIVSALGEDIQEVAYLSRYKDQDESADLYKVRLNMLEERIDDRLSTNFPEYELD